MIDGTDQTNKFLYKKVGRFASSYQGFVIFTYGIGTSGDYHSVRGQGYDVYPIHGALNIAYCQVLGAGDLRKRTNLPAQGRECARRKCSSFPTGPYNLITRGSR